MKTPVRVPPDLHAWAGRNLDVAADANPSEARSAFLRKLPDSQWVPPAALEESQEYWSRPAGDKMFPALLEQAIPDEEFRLRAQVDDLAERYFDLDPAQRGERHRSLAQQCAWSVNLSARLQSLAPGLKLKRRPWEHARDTEQELVEHLCRLFTLAPADRARRRWEILQEMEAAPAGRHGWAETVRSVRRNHPELASLEPVLVQELAAGVTPNQWNWGKLPEATPAPAPATSGKSGGFGWAWLSVLVVVGALIRTCGLDRNQPAPPPPPRFQAPQFQQDDFLKKLRENVPANFGEDLAKKLRKGQEPPKDNPLPPEKKP